MNAASHTSHVLLEGTAVSSGIARGTAFVCHCDEDPVTPRRTITDVEVEQELARLDCAVVAAEAEFASLRENVGCSDDNESLQILDSEAGLLRDPLLYDAARERCRRGHVNAEAALHDVAAELTRAFAGIDDALIRARITDVRDVTRRVQRHLTGTTTALEEPPRGSILVTHELLPSVAIRMDREQIRGVVAEQGALTAHALILARSAGVPTVIHVPDAANRITTGTRVIVDGTSGRVFVNPPLDVEREYDRVEAAFATRQLLLRDLVDRPAVTRDNTRITLNANIGLVADASMAAAAGADGVGLYRTEFVFIAQDHLPSEDEQLSFYRKAADCLRGRPLTIRVLDLGSDKLLSYLPRPRELNPSLGRRGTRLLLAQRDMLVVQLRAILRLGASCPVALLFPMISSVDEIVEAKKAVELAKQQLGALGLPYDPNMRIGAMIETPAAAIMVQQIAGEVDFLSIGTNDLVQYLLVTDRTSRELANYYEPLHPAVIRTLRSIFDSAETHGREISICGEVAGNSALTALLLGLGARSFSVAPTEILEVKRVIRQTDLSEAEDLARKLLQASTINEAKTIFRDGLAKEQNQQRRRRQQPAGMEAHEEKLLDDALKETFPASDPVSIYLRNSP